MILQQFAHFQLVLLFLLKFLHLFFLLVPKLETVFKAKMNFIKPLNECPRLMQDGDLIVVYERHDSMDHFYLETGKILNNKFGSFHHNDFIGSPFGSKINSKCTDGWLYALEPTPELWALAVHVSC